VVESTFPFFAVGFVELILSSITSHSSGALENLGSGYVALDIAICKYFTPSCVTCRLQMDIDFHTGVYTSGGRRVLAIEYSPLFFYL